nr:LLM class flavin-dependent oxidoreductase [Sphingobium sp. BYY-5]
MSEGRAGWNIVTTGNRETSRNFGSDQHLAHAIRYARAREFYDVVTGLWDSWAGDAFVRDVEAGIYFDPDKLHVLDNKGPHLSVRGPLNIARPVQGWPVIVQAGASEPGKQLAAETAEEVIFGAEQTIEGGKRFAFGILLTSSSWWKRQKLSPQSAARIKSRVRFQTDPLPTSGDPESGWSPTSNLNRVFRAAEV